MREERYYATDLGDPDELEDYQRHAYEIDVRRRLPSWPRAAAFVAAVVALAFAWEFGRAWWERDAPNGPNSDGAVHRWEVYPGRPDGELDVCVRCEFTPDGRSWSRCFSWPPDSQGDRNPADIRPWHELGIEHGESY